MRSLIWSSLLACFAHGFVLHAAEPAGRLVAPTIVNSTALTRTHFGAKRNRPAQKTVIAACRLGVPHLISLARG